MTPTFTPTAEEFHAMAREVLARLRKNPPREDEDPSRLTKELEDGIYCALDTAFPGALQIARVVYRHPSCYRSVQMMQCAEGVFSMQHYQSWDDFLFQSSRHLLGMARDDRGRVEVERVSVSSLLRRSSWANILGPLVDDIKTQWQAGALEKSTARSTGSGEGRRL